MDINININTNGELKRLNIDFTLALILFVSFILRFYNIGFQSVWLDELHTMKESNPDFTWREFNEVIMFREGIPHLHFILVKTAMSIFGYSIEVARSISAIFGVLSVFYVFKTAAVLYDKTYGYISSLLFSFSVFSIEYSQEARTYSMLLFFAIVAFYKLVVFIKSPTKSNALLLGLFAGLIPNAHPLGLLNSASIYLVLFIYLLFQEDKVTYFKKIFISGIVAIIVFLPSLPILLKVSEFSSFWIPKPNIDYLYQVLLDLFDKSTYLLVLFLILYFFLMVVAIQSFHNYRMRKEKIIESPYFLPLTVLHVWLLFEVIVIVVKSYLGISIILHRYFIAVLPTFYLLSSLGIRLIKSKKVMFSITGITLVLLIFNLFYIKNYYNKVVKSQFDLVTQFVKSKDGNKTQIISNWGWLMGYYLPEKEGYNVVESSLEKHISDMENGIKSPTSFWYVDGNSRPFTLTEAQQKYLANNFILLEKANFHDAWAVKYKSIHNENAFVDLKSFSPGMFDGTGALIFVENKSVSHPAINLDSGNYELKISGLSLPQNPINDENAHLIVLINNKKVDDFYLSNNPQNKGETVAFKHSGGNLIITLQYDNDFAKGDLDRNGIVSAISLVRKDK